MVFGKLNLAISSRLNLCYSPQELIWFRSSKVQRFISLTFHAERVGSPGMIDYSSVIIVLAVEENFDTLIVRYSSNLLRIWTSSAT